MQIRNWRLVATVATLALTLTGCGTSGLQTPLTAGSTASTGAWSYQSESVPNQTQLDKLAAQSPDQLIENAPLEPGLSKFGPQPPKEDLGNFGKLDDTLWRGARPTAVGIQKLVDMGVKTVVDFENDQAAVQTEQGWCQAKGVKFINIPLSVVTPPKMEEINQFLTLAEDPANRPLYFHCMQGRDRTGTGAFCYRTHHDHWTYDKAYAEMVQYHFHTYLLGLRGFILWYAKYEAAKPITGEPTAAANSL